MPSVIEKFENFTHVEKMTKSGNFCLTVERRFFLTCYSNFYGNQRALFKTFNQNWALQT